MSEFYQSLMQGMQEMEEYLQGKRTLRTETIEKKSPVDITPTEVKHIRESLNLSQAVFARKLRTSVRTYQGWEQGKSTPNPQAILLLKMVEKSPELFEQIASL